MVRHFGLFKFKDGVDANAINECFEAMESMVGKVPGLLEIEHGAHNSDEGLDDGFTHGFIMSFEDAEARDAYLPHPVHESVKDIVVPRLERVIVLDFESKKKLAAV